MKERPILMSAPMVRAILAGSKTQTRRAVKPQPADVGGEWRYDKRKPMGQMTYWWPDGQPANDKFVRECCPYGAPGDRIFVREAWRAPKSWDDTPPRGINDIERLSYIADEITIPPGYGRYRHARFMPRAFCRLVLEITAVRVERLQEISYADCIAEGIVDMARAEKRESGPGERPVEQYRALWDSLNVKRGFGWDANPWCWAITFKRIEEARQAA